MTARLVGAAAGFSVTVVVGFVLGLLAYKVTGAGGWVIVGLFAGLGAGVAAVAVALRPFLKSNRP
jgi:F0F1-type ATP synthase assembly protein I